MYEIDMSITTLNQDELRQAREWLADCTWRDLEPEDIETLGDVTVCWGIAKHFAGGLEEFKLTCVPHTIKA